MNKSARRCFGISLRSQTALALGGSIVFAIGHAAAPAQAQNVFCPGGNLNGGGPTTLQSGLCTNGATGAFSTAALSSQSLSEVSQSTTQQSNNQTLEAIGERRRTEAQRRTTAAAPARDAEDPPRRRAPRQTETLTRDVPTAPPPPEAPMVYKAPAYYKADPYLIDSYVPAAWVHAYGNYEHRTAAFQANGAAIGGGSATPMNISIDSKTDTWGLVAGFDITRRNVAHAGDVWIGGLLAGYMESNVTLNASGLSTNTAAAGNSFSTMHIRLNGPTVGAFSTYFWGPWSTDLTVKADFLNLGENFFEVFGFNAGAGTVPYAGMASTHVTNISTLGNVYYKIQLAPTFWVEPTVGFIDTSSLYDSGAAALGLSDGYVFRLHGGARFSTDCWWDGVHVTPSLTARAYDDVKVVGGPIQNGAFIGGPLLPNDQGKVRGEGILAFNFDHGHGLSSFVQGQVYGGQDLFGAGGKGGVRIQW
jgi:hypothetical protein